MYTTKAHVENYLKRGLSDRESNIFPMLAEAATEYIDSEIGTTFADNPDAASRYYDSEGQAEINIDPLRLDTGDTVTVALVDQYGDVTNTYEDDEFVLYPRNKVVKTSIRKRGSRFPTGVANIKVTGKFTSNVGTMPRAVNLAATMLVAEYLDGNENIKSESIEGWSITYGDMPDLASKVSELLAPYRRLML